MRNVLVTGASRGLGLGIAETLAASGFRVLAIARTESDALRARRDQVTAAGVGGLEFHASDLSRIERIPELVRALRSEFGRFYGLVNNAAASDTGLLANAEDTSIEALVRLNVLSPLVLTKYVVRSMMAGQDGRIVNVASIVGATGYVGLSVYSATKSSMVGFTRSLARELGPRGITVNAVAPGFIATDMTRELDAPARAKIAGRSALRRMPEVVDVANAVDFLFSEKARNITGTVTTVDAGNTA